MKCPSPHFRRWLRTSSLWLHDVGGIKGCWFMERATTSVGKRSRINCCVSIAALLINVKAAEPQPPPQVWMAALHLLTDFSLVCGASITKT